MTKTITIRTCDVCGKEVENLPGTLQLKYSDSDYMGCGYPAGVQYEDICIDCCRKLDKVIDDFVKEAKISERV